MVPVIVEVVSVYKTFKMRNHLTWHEVRIELVDSGGSSTVTNRGTMCLDCYSTTRFDMFCLNGLYARVIRIKVKMRSMKISITFNSHWKKLRLRASSRGEFLGLFSELRAACGDIPVRVVDFDLRSSTFSSHSWANNVVENGDADTENIGEDLLDDVGDEPLPAVGTVHLSLITPYRLRRP
ncbi:hypothetical protein Poli38472_008412 [Pythium oligandrum]|uniref:Uncharacterized protein n=1 Tax=Pythium oligandrum TaxID=41045 RepID=A0A8K1CM21_PYTOL|nr:hypothetical protein Poli38472_008412 [Pythium oligandrum]|eukprot:TMW65770.1 hypothetical protein Poli38472_008412 [Pythium oligandrum]